MQLWLCVQLGKIVTGGAGLVITEQSVRQTTKIIATLQDLIKLTYPLRATHSVFVMARKNRTPHVIPNPLWLKYEIERAPPDQGLPSPYRLRTSADRKHIWQLRGFFYRGSYSASVKTRLFGKNLMTDIWEAYFIE